MNFADFDSLIHPRSIAVVGISDRPTPWNVLKILREFGFQGRLYPVNSRCVDVLGCKAYASVAHIPDPVDYAFLMVPAQASLQVMQDCATKGVKLVALYTAGFGESEVEGGSELEQALINTARQGGVRLLGPNCLGFYCPDAGITFNAEFPKESGSVSILCQSGGHSGQLVNAAIQHGIRFSKVIGYGNAADLDETEIMEYLAQDSQTKLIMAYIEGARQGKRFFEVLRKATQAKPVIILKGGRSESGAAITLSHTRSLAGSKEVWDSLLKQAGAIQAYSIDECIDIAQALLFMKPPKGRRTAVIGIGGGASVLGADDCSSAGLTVPPIPNEVKQELKKFVLEAGNIFRNPMDFSAFYGDPREMGRAIQIVGNWTGIDILILHAGAQVGGISLAGHNMLAPIAEILINAATSLDKPAALVTYGIYSVPAYQEVMKLQQMCADVGLPFYPSIYRAASAIDKLIRYYQGMCLKEVCLAAK